MRIAALGSAALTLLIRAEGASPNWYPYSQDNWATSVDNSNVICKDGTEQSPIDFPSCAAPVSRPAPTITWASQTVELLNNGHTVQLTAKGASPGKMAYDIAALTKEYTLVQCHFHWGSEHTVGAAQLPFETHCVHTLDGVMAGQRYGVFGIFYEVGSTANTFLSRFENDLPTHALSTANRRLQSSNVSFDLLGNPIDKSTKRRLATTPTVSTSYTGPLDFKELYSGVDLTHYWNYDGSFTTPPCTEAVDFYIYMKKATMSQAQLDKFKTAIGWSTANGNFRPAQAMYSRSIYGCSSVPSPTGDHPWYPYNAKYWEDSVGAASHALCRFGSQQSPIDFAMCDLPTTRPAVAITWATQTVELINNGHTVQLTAKGTSPGKMTVNGITYTLVQCHFHYGSEHTVSTMQMPFEAHCVHSKDGTGVAPHYGVFGLFYELGSTTNSFLAKFEDTLPKSSRRLESLNVSTDMFGWPMEGDSHRRLASSNTVSTYTGPLDFRELYGTNQRTNYWNYAGSFTTPPCTEAVDFYIMMDPAIMTNAQLDKFKHAIGWESAYGNFRPPQPLGSRTVSGCTTVVPDSSNWYPYSHSNWASNVGANSAQICKDGTEQSPIDFPVCASPVTRPAPTITWKSQTVELINNGHTVQLTAKDASPGGMSYALGGITKAYTLVQCHFHWGSEHTIGGTQTPLEAHCVHTMDTIALGARYGVFGVFYEVTTTSNAFLTAFDSQLPTHSTASANRRLDESEVSFDLMGNPMDSQTKRRLASGTTTSSYTGPLDFNQLYTGVDLTKYWNYDGSFTTPPCTEAVDFYIYQTKAQLTQAQLDKFKTAIGWGTAGGNFRPPQALNTRSIYGCDSVPSATGDYPWYPYDAKTWEDGVGVNSHALCRYGTHQSPIDFAMCQTAASRPAISISWAKQTVELLNNGHTVQLTAKDGSPGKMVVNGVSYTLVQCHFHYGSEHTISTMQTPFEAHCVHSKDGTGQAPHYGVFGLFFEIGSAANPFLALFEDSLPAKARRLYGHGADREAMNVTFDVQGNPLDPSTKRRLASTPSVSSWSGPLDFKMLYGSNSLTHYWDYHGSFTTPPCTEAVDFFIMMEPATMTTAQLNKFKTAIGWGAEGGNFRPPQPLGSRTVSGCTTSVANGQHWYPYSHSNWASRTSNHNPLCKDGTMQSPIDFPFCGGALQRPQPTITWANQNVELLNNGHTIQLTAKGTTKGGMSFDIAGTTKAYTLVQCHYHYGSEHTVGGTQIDLEAHCVHTLDGSDSNQRYGVFGVFFETGFKTNAFLAQFEDEMPAHIDSYDHRRLDDSEAGNDMGLGFDIMGNPMDANTKRRLASNNNVSAFTGPVDFKKLYDGLDLNFYWNYDGSFTTPPCTEAVDFYIFMDRSQVTAAQLDKMKTAIGWNSAGGNFRPPQALNTRTIYGCTVTPGPLIEKHWYPYSADNWVSMVGANSNAICKDGTHQSPIDFAMCATPESRTAVSISWAQQNVELLNNGHTVQLTAKGTSPGKMVAKGHTYTLVQCHFHYGSEHFVSTMQLPFEAHCVHSKDGTGQSPHYGVFGIFFEIGATENTFLKNFEDVLPKAASARRLEAANVSFNVFGNPLDELTNRRLGSNTVSTYTGPLDFKQLYGTNSLTHYWDYHGSFTTPPCTEAVDFYIMMEPAVMTQAQLDKFKTAIGWSSAGGNFRPPQPLGSRTVSGCTTPVADSSDWYPYSYSNWATMVSNANHLCKDGTEQSPINFPVCTGALIRTAPTITWAQQNVELLNNGHTVQLTAKGTTTGKMTYAIAGTTKAYTLVQCHFHFGSEHEVGGVQYPFETHCVHTLDGSDSNQRYGVFGIMYEVGFKTDQFVAQFEDSLPSHSSSSTKRRLDEKAVSFDLFGNPMDSQTKRRLATNVVSSYTGPVDFKQLYNDIDLQYYWSYDGSFTTPPCTEAVDFYIYMSKGCITQVQLDKFHNAIGWKNAGGNFRPVQALNTRTIYGCTATPGPVADKAWYPYTSENWASSVGVNSNQLCKTGSEQSPIDFVTCTTPEDSTAITTTWASQNVELLNNGHTVQLTAKGADPGKMSAGGKTYTLVQCHFHWGSEHTVGGHQYEFEAHCVHSQDSAGQSPHYGVFGQFFEVGSTPHTFLSSFEDHLPSQPTRRLAASNVSFDLFGNPMDGTTKRRLAANNKVSSFTGPIDFKTLYGNNALKHYWSYGGSFTTPPCTEAVDFYILMDVATMTQAQLDKFKTAIGWSSAQGNFRPPQPLHSRVVSGCAVSAAYWYPYNTEVWATTADKANAVCKDGMAQSPINFPACPGPLIRPAPTITWATQTIELINTGRAIQINAKGSTTGGMSYVIAGATKAYTLVQCHMHWGSEHYIGNAQLPFETHCVHTSDGTSGSEQRYGVFGVFYEVGSTANPFLADIESHLVQHSNSKDMRRLDSMNSSLMDLMGNPMDATTKRRLAIQPVVSTFTGPLDFKKLYQGIDLTNYWNYEGSFTTPPCTEAVDFYIFMKKAMMTQQQLDKFKLAIGWSKAGGNFRPPQALNGRTIYGCTVTPSPSDHWYPYSTPNWATAVSGANHVCRDGLKQSPIDFPTCPSPISRPAPTITWASQNVELLNNGHAVQLTAKGATPGGMSYVIGGITKEYTLVQCHFHFGSEHTIGGTQYPFETHCVHSLNQGAGDAPHYGVFGIFYEVKSTPNAFLAVFEDHLPQHTSSATKRRLHATNISFDLFGNPMDSTTNRRLADANVVSQTYSGPLDYKQLYQGVDLTNYWNYDGSFTTPPCTQAVDFYIYMQKASMTQGQLDKFTTAIGWKTAGGNYRPPQALNGRTIYGCTVTPAPSSGDKPWYPYNADHWAASVGVNSNAHCKDGTEQSPINFDDCKNPKDRSAVAVNWPVQNVELINNGHAVQITAKGTDTGKMVAAGKFYSLVQCHFHYGSEHTVSNSQFPFEAHCVHSRDSGETARYGVFGIFYIVGQTTNAFLATFEDQLPAHTRRLSPAGGVSFDLFGNPMDGETKRRLASGPTVSSWTGPSDLKKIYDGVALNRYWNYEGSFTTPPCTEAVDFYIMMQPATMTQSQLDKFKTAIGWSAAGGNFRPPQPLGSRTVIGCDVAQVTSSSSGTDEEEVNTAIRPGFAGLLMALVAMWVLGG
eukprot:CAMPEP_0197870628 /NCGR_PEP_ID=MMETSP1439-20131203/1238_1 /TAXON_ID=66791 /ORGANISM="Gonyaulax spinifera, Strain CCMP409" /LENGTH=3111 /DNA_ID=CAMNT_0043489523 /DNA_START=82 /DNA_END=9417 /DNA_ORIENTATION=+